MKSTTVIFSLLALLTTPTVAAQELDRLGEARKLYESAEYARALSTLERIEPAAMTPEQTRDRLLYQALCLLALENQPALETKIQEIVQADPLFDPGSNVPPRLRTLVADARGRLRPALVQAHYRSGKERFEAGDHASALRELTLAIQLAGDAPADDAEMADLKLLAEGFRDLAKRALETPPKPEAKPQTTVVPPVVIQQEMPAWPASLSSHLAQQGEAVIGVVQIVVNKTGQVDSVTLLKRIHPVYDALLVSAAKAWRYEPATMNGEPIEFVKRLNVKVAAR